MIFEHLMKKTEDSDTFIILRSIVKLIHNRDKIQILDYIEITDLTAMKIDLLSKKYYGNSDDAWIILKYNQISNPLAMPVGKTLAIPNKESFIAVIKEIDVNITTRKFLGGNQPKNITGNVNPRSSISGRNKTFSVNNGTLTI